MTMTRNVYTEIHMRAVTIPAGFRGLEGILSIPSDAEGIVVFADGSGSGRFSPRNQFVARALEQAGLATLLFDLLGPDEDANRRKVFDIALLADRLQAAADWLGRDPGTRHLTPGYFGASTGAAAALVAAARQPRRIGAVVSRGGRPDLAGDVLPMVEAPTLLIVGGCDEAVLMLNRGALDMLRCPKELVVIPGATHLFPEPGAIGEVARLARHWFTHYLTPEAVDGGPGRADAHPGADQ
jgi:putative phosphoribosyl transferase